MRYHYAQRRNYEDYSGGRVFYSLPGVPAFPVRLASEIFQRCLEHRRKNHLSKNNQLPLKPVSLYDPCCGVGYSLSVIAHLHYESIKKVIASDIDEDLVSFAGRNLSLITIDGLDQRIIELKNLYRKFGKESHIEAIDSAQGLREKLAEKAKNHPLEINAFQADATDPASISSLIGFGEADIVFADVPYGSHAKWQGARASDQERSPTWHLLNSIKKVISPSSVIAISSDKKQKASHEDYQRLERIQVGKRKVLIFRILGSG